MYGNLLDCKWWNRSRGRKEVSKS